MLSVSFFRFVMRSDLSASRAAVATRPERVRCWRDRPRPGVAVPAAFSQASGQPRSGRRRPIAGVPEGRSLRSCSGPAGVPRRASSSWRRRRRNAASARRRTTAVRPFRPPGRLLELSPRWTCATFLFATPWCLAGTGGRLLRVGLTATAHLLPVLFDDLLARVLLSDDPFGLLLFLRQLLPHF